MVDGVVDIPLPGCSLEPDGDDLGTAARGHFLAGPENRLVEVAVHGVLAESDRRRESPPTSPRNELRDSADRPDTCYNPLVLYGPSGTGKSHVARGLAAAWKARNRRHRVVCATAVEFARELAEAIESQAVEEFRTKYRTADLLVLEDFGHLTTRKSDKLSAQEEFVHTLDALLAQERWVVVTASAAPAELPGLLPMLQSRLAGGLTIPLAPPGPAARRAVLRQLAAIREVELPEAVAEVLAEGLSGTVPQLAGALTQLAAPAEFDHEPIDVHRAKKYLAEQNHQRQPSMHEIALATSRHFTLRLADVRSSVRRRALVTARGVAVYLARHYAGKSLQEIGCYFGGRDHSTVMHSCRQTKRMSESDPTIHEAIEQLRKKLWKT